MNVLTLDNLWWWKEQYPHWWFIKPLTEEEIDFINTNGKKRNAHGKAKGMFSKTKNGDDRWDVSGMAGELAASLIYNVRMGRILGDTRKELNEGDLLSGGIKIESKSCLDCVPNRFNLVVNADHLHDERPYTNTITALYPNVLINIGWAWGHEVRKRGRVSVGPTNHKIHILDFRDLHDPKSLFDVLREKR